MDNVLTSQSVYFKEVINMISAMETEVDMMREGNLTCEEKWMNGDAVREKLGISIRTLQNYRDSGVFPYSAVGGKFYYNLN
jgi:hypothetical protein